jgi:hypothetical protein
VRDRLNGAGEIHAVFDKNTLMSLEIPRDAHAEVKDQLRVVIPDGPSHMNRV